MTPEERSKKLTAFADGELSVEEADAVRALLVTDIAARAELAAIEALPRLARAWAVPVATVDIWSRIQQVLPEELAETKETLPEETVPAEFLAYVAALTELSELPTLSIEQEKQLAVSVEQGEKWAREALVNANLRLVHAIAKRYQNRGIAMEELIREATLGLTQAVDRYDYRRGFRFSTYATHWIRQALNRAIESPKGNIRTQVTTPYADLQREAEAPPPPPSIVATALASPSPDEETRQLLRTALAELRSVREEVNALRDEIASLRQEREQAPSPARPQASQPARLFPFAPPESAQRYH